MPRPAITPEKKADMRQRIREATSRVIQRMQIAPNDGKGYSTITIRDITDEAGISIGTFYKYFDSREDLGQSLWSEPVDQLKAVMQADYDRARTPAKKIRVLLEHYVNFSVENRRVFRAAFLFVRADGAKKPRLQDLEQEMFYRNLKTAFEDGQESGVFRSFNTHEMAQLFWAAIHGSLALPENLDRYDFESPQTLAAAMINELLALIANPK